MKKIYLLIVLFLGFAGGSSLMAQTGIDVIFSDQDTSDFIPPPQTICSGTAYSVWTGGRFSTNVPPGTTGQVDIDWGDGTVENHPFSYPVTPGANYAPNVFAHTYGMGAFNPVFIYSDSYGYRDTITFAVSSTPNCGRVYAGVLLDNDGNGSGDISLSGAQIDFTDAASNTTTYVIGSSGISGVDVTASPYTVTVNPAWMAANNYINSVPASQTVNFSGSPYVQLPSFVVQCDPSAPASQVDLGIRSFYGWGFRAGQNTGSLNITVCNYTCAGAAPSANLSITFDPLLSIDSHNIPGATVSGNVISANVSVTGCVSYTIYFDVPGTAPAGTPLSFSGSVTAVGSTDFDLSNNAASCVSEVRNSWDPNDKSVSQPAIVSPAVRDEFTYVIRFQNMGNDDAFNIVIKDTLDNDLDLSTFSLLELSHTGSVGIDPATRIATFTFPNIFLPAASVDEPGSHGYAVYKITEKPALPVGTEIRNTAYIYFDMNPPIITNTTSNVNQTMDIDEAAAIGLALYPVPAGELLTVSFAEASPAVISLVDVTGKTVLSVNTVQATHTLDVSQLASGVYTLCVRKNDTLLNRKVIIGKP